MNKKAKIQLIGVVILVCILFIGLAAAAKPVRAPKECNDKIDNDGDGNIDLADSGCDNKNDRD